MLSSQIEIIAASLAGNASEVFTYDDLLVKLKISDHTKTPLRIKFGADPSSADLHLGHAVVLRKLRQFQEFGHKVVLIVGDFTATIGDPTGKSKTRPVLSLEQTRAYAASYVEQVGCILKTTPELLEVRYNSEWLSKVDLAEIISIASSATVAQILQREDFAKRYASGSPIGIHELLYPLLQAHDSWAINADVELGGSDQLFNCLMGRAHPRIAVEKRQVVMLMPLLRGMDGNEKMSKSLGNHIGIASTPWVMFEQLMQIPDTLLEEYCRLCSTLDFEAVNSLIKIDPYQAHRMLAQNIVEQYHGRDEALGAEERYNYVSANTTPSVIDTYILKSSELNQGKISTTKLLTICGLTSSNSEAQRLVASGAIFIDNEKCSDGRLPIVITNGMILRRGKNKFIKIKFID